MASRVALGEGAAGRMRPSVGKMAVNQKNPTSLAARATCKVSLKNLRLGHDVIYEMNRFNTG